MLFQSFAFVNDISVLPTLFRCFPLIGISTPPLANVFILCTEVTTGSGKKVKVMGVVNVCPLLNSIAMSLGPILGDGGRMHATAPSWRLHFDKTGQWWCMGNRNNAIKFRIGRIYESAWDKCTCAPMLKQDYLKIKGSDWSYLGLNNWHSDPPIFKEWMRTDGSPEYMRMVSWRCPLIVPFFGLKPSISASWKMKGNINFFFRVLFFSESESGPESESEYIY